MPHRVTGPAREATGRFGADQVAAERRRRTSGGRAAAPSWQRPARFRAWARAAGRAASRRASGL